MTEARPARPLVVVAVLLLTLPMAACGWWRTTNVDARGEVTVFNRTANALTVTDSEQTFTVAGCGEAGASNFRFNRWTISDPFGREKYSGGGGSFGQHAYIVITADSSPNQTDSRPSSLPRCQGTPARL